MPTDPLPSCVSIPAPPFWGAMRVDLPLPALFEHLNQPALFRIGWGAGKAVGEKWDRLQRDFRLRLAKMKQTLLEDNWLRPKAAYGFWPCAAMDGVLLIDPIADRSNKDPIRLPVPRQSCSPYRSLSDTFTSAEDKQKDLIAFQVVTMGTGAVKHVRRLRAQSDPVEAYFAHGLAAQLTEAAANYTLALIRADLGLESQRGKRYSWGYEPLPDLAQQVSILKMLDPDHDLQIEFTSACQFIPEYSTAALFAHHPDARYFRMNQ